MSAVEGGRLGLFRGGSPILPAPVVPGLSTAVVMEGGPPEKSLKEGCVCCHDGFERCCVIKKDDR